MTPRSPLLPVLRMGVALVIGGVLLHCPRAKKPTPERPTVTGVWATDLSDSGPGFLKLGEKAVGPLPGQKRPPCAKPREREIVGGCWIRTEHEPPCPDGLYEGQGMCLIPVEATKRLPTSIHK